MSYSIDCFRKYEIRNMMDYSGDYEFKMIDECEGDYIYPSTLSEINNFLENYSLQILYTLVPSFGGGECFEGITQKEAENIAKRFIEPVKCIAYIENNNILEKIEENKPQNYERMLFTLKNLIDKWKEDYYVYEWY
ncbi:hypothetical protein [Clostridium sp.]|uniref:hypothetical protein n=1 Tax=Clostridium sp. TaxID=1506 RepID=UPI00284889F6|nr:hypothetical protein [Clostridium sp.]MDR3598422.1 hypothetical protein [Clostridium sp.]